jgi:hypothetical protein
MSDWQRLALWQFWFYLFPPGVYFMHYWMWWPKLCREIKWNRITNLCSNPFQSKGPLEASFDDSLHSIVWIIERQSIENCDAKKDFRDFVVLMLPSLSIFICFSYFCLVCLSGIGSFFIEQRKKQLRKQQKMLSLSHILFNLCGTIELGFLLPILCLDEFCFFTFILWELLWRLMWWL